METIGQFQKMIDNLPVLLDRLRNGPAMHRNGLRNIPKNGIYAFYEDGEPIYIGRSSNMRNRLMSHGRPSSGHQTATFAFILAVKDAKARGVDTSRSRDELQNDSDFDRLYSSSKSRVRDMQVRVVEIDDAIEQTVFEVYAALALETPYNTFENH